MRLRNVAPVTPVANMADRGLAVLTPCGTELFHPALEEPEVVSGRENPLAPRAQLPWKNIEHGSLSNHHNEVAQ